MRLEALNQFSVIKQGDTKNEFRFKLLDYSDSPIDLTDKTVTISIANDTGKILDKDPTVEDAAAGIISFSFMDEDVTGFGDMKLEVHVTDAAGKKQIVPSSGYYKFVIDRNLDDASAGVTNYTLQYFTAAFDNKMADFDSAMTTIGTAAENAKTKATELEDRVDQAIAAGTVDLELKDARNEYVNLKARLDAGDVSLAQKAKIYGVFWNKSSDPTLQRTNDAIGMDANVAQDDQVVWNDFDDTEIYRDIKDVIDEYGNVFVRIPKFYIRKIDASSFMSIQISLTKYKGFYLPWCFWDFVNNRELLYVDIGKYKASLSADNKLESKPYKYPLVSKNIVQFRDFARANGAGYQQLDIHVYDVLNALITVEFATLNGQSVMQGFTTGQYTDTHRAVIAETATNRIIVPNETADLYRVGQAISVGTTQGGNQIFYGRTITAIEVYDASNKAVVFDGVPVDIAIDNRLYNTGWKNGFSLDIAASSGSIGSNTDGKYPCSYRGIESPWGDVWQFVDGVNINEFQAWVCKDATQYASNVFAAPYEQLGYVNGETNGYVKEVGFDPNLPFAQFPIAVGGGTTTYYSDYYYQSTGQRIALVGGCWYYGSSAGLSYWSLYNASSRASVDFGGRLLKKAS